MPKGIPVPPGTLCAVPECVGPHSAHGYCSKHAARFKRHGDPLGGQQRRSGSLIERALADLDQPAEGCWEWSGKLNDSGYGYFRVGRRIHRVHIVTYEHFVGPVPEGLELDHLCRNRACARPDHLEAVTHAENIRRAAAARTHCVRDHPFAGANLRIDSRGRRVCVACVQGRTAEKRRGPFVLTCQECGSEFTSARSSTVCCSKPCRWRSWSKRRAS